MNLYRLHPNHVGEPIDYPGIHIEMEWLSKDEENLLVTGMDEMPWDSSQSGRRKQNFGPKCNFKKMKMKVGDFKGFPAFSKFVQQRFNEVPVLAGYRTIEQCSLEYDPLKGASIDPHIDDCWIWGERIVTVNLLSDTVLTMTPYLGETWRYNLPLVSSYEPVFDEDGVITNTQIRAMSSSPFESKSNQKQQDIRMSLQPKFENIVVRIPMPQRSLLVIYGPPRYAWEHRVLREDVSERRLCIAYREFTPPYLPGGDHENESADIFNMSNQFWNHNDQQNETVCL